MTSRTDKEALIAYPGCGYCKGAGEIEMDNNGPIVRCPVCERIALRTQATTRGVGND
jgi:hypothetical protein